MDLATIIGAVLANGLILIAIGPANIGYFIDIPSVQMVIGGAAAYLLIALPLKDCMAVVTIYKNTFFAAPPDLGAEMGRLVEFATIARRDGLLALEEKLKDLSDPFLLRGIQLIIDGVAPDSVKSIMEIEIGQTLARHSRGKMLIDQLGACAPAFGMIGTLVGLVLMLQNLDDPSALGPGMAVALITTFYGAFIANVLCLPFANKLDLRNKEELQARQLMLEGVLAIQAGENPNVIRERLAGYLSPAARPAKE